jgi:hypothetical protein
MSEITVKFKNCPEFDIELYNNTTVNLFLEILKNNLSKELPIFRDPKKYTEEYLGKLIIEVKEKLGWDWLKDQYSIENTVKFHKDIESLLDKEGDFSKIPGDLQNLIHEAHFCIHAIQYLDIERPRGPFLQLEWFNDDYVNLPKNAEFNQCVNFGDLILQNAYVGHPPIQCWQQNDYKNIERTCAFPDRIKPGIKINLCDPAKKFNWDLYESWWRTNCTEFVNRVSFEKIKYYTGFNIIGKVKNTELLKNILNEPLLEVEKVYIHDQI